jgi:voltage-gated potassium channel
LKRFRFLMLLVALVVSIGTAGFHVIEGWPWFDAFYMVVITVSTIGYQEVHPLSEAGRIFNVVLITAGVGLVFFSIGIITQVLLEFELDKVFGRAKMEREIDKLTGHYIICGAGRVGRRVAYELARKPAPFVVIENDAKRQEALDSSWLVLDGDATREDTLKKARIDQAAGLVAAATTDATNIYIVLTARSLSSSLRIIARASDENAEKHLKTAGADTVISPYNFAGHRIAQSFLRPNVVDFLDVAVSRDMHEEMVIEEVLVTPNSRYANASVGESKIHKQLGIMVLAIKRASGPPVFNPAANETIQAGDFLIVMGEVAKMGSLESIAAGK